MTVRINPIAEVNQRANAALVDAFGVVDTIRFLSQFRGGGGDYTKERQQLFGDMTTTSIIAEIKSRRSAAATNEVAGLAWRHVPTKSANLLQRLVRRASPVRTCTKC